MKDFAQDLNPFVFCLSGGRSSAYALYLVKDELKPTDIVIFNNTGLEHEETLIFIKKIGEHLNIPIVWTEYDYTTKPTFKIIDFETASRNGEPFKKLVDNRSSVPNARMRFCTVELKIKTTERYIKSLGKNPSDYTKILGIRYDEKPRADKHKDISYLPLYDKKITVEQVRRFWASQPYDLNVSDLYSNCNLCFHKRKSQKLTILLENPQIADFWADIEQEKGHTFAPDFSVLELLELSKKKFSKHVDFWDTRTGDLFETGCFCGD